MGGSNASWVVDEGLGLGLGLGEGRGEHLGLEWTWRMLRKT